MKKMPGFFKKMVMFLKNFPVFFEKLKVFFEKLKVFFEKFSMSCIFLNARMHASVNTYGDISLHVYTHRVTRTYA